MIKLWGGRFKSSSSDITERLSASIHYDCRLYKHDIIGSIAHAKMLKKIGILTDSELSDITNGLKRIEAEIDNGEFEFSSSLEDIHMNIESKLTEYIGDAGKKLHTARSRNDQVALDMRLYLRDEVGLIDELLKKLILSLIELAKQNKHVILPGYTHLQRAQPITFAHHLMAYAQMFYRDLTRLMDCFIRMDEMPLGSLALAGTTYKIDREFVAGQLGFSKTTENSLDSVSDRDFCIELASVLSLIMLHLSRFCEEIILWASWEFKFIEIDDAFATGSSIMPQKKNPDVAELVRGKTGRVYGDLISLLATMKSLPLAYNKDMQEDKEAIFDAVDTVKLCLNSFIPMIESMTVLKENMRSAAAKGFINATDCADYLVKKGLPFRDAYKITGELVAFCVETNKTLETLSIEKYVAYSNLFEADIKSTINLENCVISRNSFGGPAPSAVKIQIENMLKKLKE